MKTELHVKFKDKNIFGKIKEHRNQHIGLLEIGTRKQNLGINT